MSLTSFPDHYAMLLEKHPAFMDAVTKLDEAVRQGPIEEKTTHLIQMAAAVGIRSVGAVHSHAKRAMLAGATPEEIKHAVIMLTGTLGFPTVAAALSWVEEVL